MNTSAKRRPNRAVVFFGQPSPVGLAMSAVYGTRGGIYADYDRFARVLSKANMLHRLLVARDVQSMVILGDPTAVLPL